MYRVSEFQKEYYKPKDVANYLNVTVRTIQNYGDSGILLVERTASDRRIISRDSLLKYLDSAGMLYDDSDELQKDRKIVVYARVSSHEQKTKGDLDRQALVLVESLTDTSNLEILKEVGSGLNDKRPKLLKLIRMVLNDEVREIHVTYKDRLTRFGFNYLQEICNQKDVKICVLRIKKDKDIEKELVDDMMSLIASFSGKLYGLRSRQNKGV